MEIINSKEMAWGKEWATYFESLSRYNIPLSQYLAQIKDWTAQNSDTVYKLKSPSAETVSGQAQCAQLPIPYTPS